MKVDLKADSMAVKKVDRRVVMRVGWRAALRVEKMVVRRVD